MAGALHFTHEGLAHQINVGNGEFIYCHAQRRADIRTGGTRTPLGLEMTLYLNFYYLSFLVFNLDS